MSGSISKMKSVVDQMEKLSIGYDQGQRWTFLKNGKLVNNSEADCSSLCGGIIKLGGYPIDLSGTFYTGNFAEKARKAGFSVIKFKKLSQVKQGDFLLQTAKHVEFAYTATRFYSAHIDERGKASGGKTGDQTGGEVGFRNAYNYSGGWTYIVRPPADSVAAAGPKEDQNTKIAKEVLAGKWGNGDDRRKRLTKAGYDYKKIQKIVNKLI